MPVTPLTTEGHAVAARMRAFPSTEGSIHCLEQLAGPDQATVTDIKAQIEASPDATQDTKDGIEAAREALSHVVASSGNVGLWPLMAQGADGLDAALAALEAEADAEQPTAESHSSRTAHAERTQQRQQDQAKRERSRE